MGIYSPALLKDGQMKRARFTEDQIIGVLKETRLGRRRRIWRASRVSEATLYNWKAKYCGMDVSEAKRLKQLEDENAKLKKLLAEPCWMPPRFASFCQKNGRARRQARRRRASSGRDGPVGDRNSQTCRWRRAQR